MTTRPDQPVVCYVKYSCSFLCDQQDRLRWYCRAPGQHEAPTVIREESFHVTDLGKDLKPLIERWITDEECRRCSSCGTIAAAK